jgi:uncharacterized protein (DUF111 family)
VTSKPTVASGLDTPTEQALARIFARMAAHKVATDGLAWLIGAGQTDPNLANTLNLPAIFAAQAGQIADMDFVAAKLVEAFPAT